eukprot:6767544-Ditylum_brightwellii.AAC.1
MSWVGGKTPCLLARSETLCLLVRLETISPLLPENRQCAEHMNQRFRTQRFANFPRITNGPSFPFSLSFEESSFFSDSPQNKPHTVFSQQDPHCTIRTQTNK